MDVGSTLDPGRFDLEVFNLNASAKAQFPNRGIFTGTGVRTRHVAWRGWGGGGLRSDLYTAQDVLPLASAHHASPKTHQSQPLGMHAPGTVSFGFVAFTSCQFTFIHEIM